MSTSFLPSLEHGRFLHRRPRPTILSSLPPRSSTKSKGKERAVLPSNSSDVYDPKDNLHHESSEEDEVQSPKRTQSPAINLSRARRTQDFQPQPDPVIDVNQKKGQ